MGSEMCIRDRLIRQHAIEVTVHCALDDFGELLRFYDIGPAIHRNLFSNQLFEQLDRQIFLLHVCDFFQKLGIKERESRLNVGKQVDDPFTLDTMLEQFIDPCINLFERIFFALSAHGQSHDQGTDCLEEGGFDALLFLYQTAAQGKRLSEQQGFPDKGIMRLFLFGQVMLLHPLSEEEVNRACDDFRADKVISLEKRCIIESVQEIAAD